MTEQTPKPAKEKRPKFRRGNNTPVGPANTSDPEVNRLMDADTHAIADVIEGKKPPKRRSHHVFTPTDEHRRRVRDLVLCQVKRDRIASLLGISLATLERHFSHELNHALDAINSKVAFTMAKLAIDGNVRAAEFWLRTQAGFRNAREEGDGDGTGNKIIIEGGLPS